VNELAQLVAIPGTAAWVGLLLCGVGFLTAVITASLGAGGGLLLLAVMTMFVPVGATIPLHGAVQLGAAVSRTALHLRQVRSAIVAAFALGALAGAAAGSQVLVRLPEVALQLVLGGFILALAWVRLPSLRHRGSGTLVALGAAITSFLTLFVGATGPLVAALLHALHLDRLAHVGTFSACMILQHGFKIAVFAFAGFAFAPYLPFLAVMLAFTLLGSWFGRRLLLRLDDARFHRALSIILTLLALRLLVAAALGIADGY
jgi:uncharacterized membrane protein YfcA